MLYKGNGHSINKPINKLSTREKIEIYGSEVNWGIEFITSIDYGYSMLYAANWQIAKQFDENLNIVERGIFNTDDLNKTVSPYTDPTIKLPADPDHYDLLTNKIMALVGEEQSRPFQFTVVNKSSQGTSAFADHQKEILTKFAEQEILKELSKYYPIDQQGQLTNEKGEPIDTTEKLQAFAKYSYADVAEKIANMYLKNITEENRLKYLFTKGNLRYFATGVEVFWVGVINGKLVTRLVDPRNFDCDLPLEEDLISKSNWAKEVRYLPLSSIMDEFYEYLTEEDVDYLNLTYSNNLSFNSILNTPSNLTYNQYNKIRVAHFEWKTYRKLGLRPTINEFGAEVKEIVSDDYKLTKEEKDSIEWFFVNERWQGVKIGDAVFVNVSPIPNQYISPNDLSKTKQHYVGIRWQYPLIEKLKPWQKLYNVVMLHLKVAMAAAGTKGFLYDDSMIPKTSGWTSERWMHFVKTGGLAPFIRNKDTSPNANPIVPYDMTLGNTIDTYVKQANFILEQMGLSSGVSPTREGVQVPNSTWGEAERSVAQSSAVTQFSQLHHQEAKREVLQAVINFMSEVLVPGSDLYYALSDEERSFIKLNDEIDLSSINVHLSNDARDLKNLEQLRILIGEGFRQGTVSPAGLLASMSSDSTAELKRVLEMEQDVKKQEAAQQQKFTMEQQQAAQQHQQQLEQFKLQFEQAKLEISQAEVEFKQLAEANKLTMANNKNETDIKIAMIRAEAVVDGYRTDIDVDKDDSGRPDFIEMLQAHTDARKQTLEEDKFEQDKNKPPIATQNGSR